MARNSDAGIWQITFGTCYISTNAVTGHYPSCPFFSCFTSLHSGSIISCLTTIASAPGNIDLRSSGLVLDDSSRTRSNLLVQSAGQAAAATNILGHKELKEYSINEIQFRVHGESHFRFIEKANSIYESETSFGFAKTNAITSLLFVDHILHCLLLKRRYNLPSKSETS